MRWPVNSPHKWPVTRKMFPFDDVIMVIGLLARGLLAVDHEIKSRLFGARPSETPMAATHWCSTTHMAELWWYVIYTYMHLMALAMPVSITDDTKPLCGAYKLKRPCLRKSSPYFRDVWFHCNLIFSVDIFVNSSWTCLMGKLKFFNTKILCMN